MKKVHVCVGGTSVCEDHPIVLNGVHVVCWYSQLCI